MAGRGAKWWRRWAVRPPMPDTSRRAPRIVVGNDRGWLYPWRFKPFTGVTLGYEPAGPGDRLTIDTGIWLNAPWSFAYQWTRDGADIPDATSSAYTVAGSDLGTLIACRTKGLEAPGQKMLGITYDAAYQVADHTVLPGFVVEDLADFQDEHPGSMSFGWGGAYYLTDPVAVCDFLS